MKMFVVVLMLLWAVNANAQVAFLDPPDYSIKKDSPQYLLILRHWDGVTRIYTMPGGHAH